MTRYSSGQITLTDTATGQLIDLGAFGSTNSESFARLMNLGRTQ
jgi:ferric-dicitrate binding protein FerR (iron transport regulator)